MERFVPTQPVGDIFTDTITGTLEGAWDAAQTPLKDVNLEQQPIPEKLQQIADNPYAIPKKLVCAGIRQEIAELDALLGPDVCTPGQPTGLAVSQKGEYIEKGIEKGESFARDEAVHIITRQVNIIPFRGILRSISGADRHEKAVQLAYQAGKLRRAFLKGVALSLNPHCLDSMPVTPKITPTLRTTVASIPDVINHVPSLKDISP